MIASIPIQKELRFRDKSTSKEMYRMYSDNLSAAKCAVCPLFS